MKTFKMLFVLVGAFVYCYGATAVDKKTAGKMLINNLNQVVEALINDDAIKKEEVAKQIKEEVTTTVTAMKVAFEQQQRDADEKRRQHLEKIAQEQLKFFDEKISTTFAKIEEKIDQNFKKLVEKSEQEKKEYGEVLAKKQLDTFDQKLSKTVANLATEDAVKKEQLAKQMKEEFAATVKVMAVVHEQQQKEVEEKRSKNLEKIAQDQQKLFQENFKKLAETSEQVKKEYGEAIAKKQLDMFGQKLSDAVAKLAADDALKKEQLVRHIKEDIAVTAKKQFDLFDQKLSDTVARLATEDTMKKEQLAKQMKEDFAATVKVMAVVHEQQQKEIEEKRGKSLEKMTQEQKKFFEENFKALADKNEKEKKEFGENLTKKQLDLIDQKVSKTTSQMQEWLDQKFQMVSREKLAAFDQNFSQALFRLQTQIDKKLQTAFLDIEKKQLKHEEDLTRRYVQVFDMKLNVAGKAMKDDVEERLLVFTKQEDEKGVKRQKEIVEKCLGFFDVKVANVQTDLKKELDKLGQDLVLSTREELRKDSSSLRNNFHRMLHEKIEIAKNELKALVTDDVIEKNKSVSSWQKQAETKLLDAAEKLTQGADKKIELLVMAEKKRREQEQAKAFEKSIDEFNSKLLSMKDDVQKEAKQQLTAFLQKEATLQQDDREKLVASYLKLFEQKAAGMEALIQQKAVGMETAIHQKVASLNDKTEASVNQKMAKIKDNNEALLSQRIAGIESSISQNFKTALLEDEGRRKTALEQQKVQLRAITEKYLQLFGDKLVAFEKDVKENTEKNIKMTVKRELTENEKWANNLESFVKAQIGEFETKISQERENVKTKVCELGTKLSQERERMQRTFEKVVQAEKQKALVANRYRKRELATVATNMMRMIEDRFGGEEADDSQEEFNILLGKLQNTRETNSTDLVELDKKLEGIQKEKMSDNGKGKISQAEIDSLVRQEVDKQLSDLSAKNDPRVDRLKKVVALEKMRRVIKDVVSREKAVGF